MHNNKIIISLLGKYMLTITLASLDQLSQIEPLFIQAIAYLKQANIDQWQHGYPNKDSIIKDIKNHACYVISLDNKIVGTMALLIGHEPTYDVIDGNWLFDEDYATIHRIAIDPAYKGKQLALKLFEFAKETCLKQGTHALRVDTHQDNLSMQKAIAKAGFTYCGVITLADGAYRLAYEVDCRIK